VDARYETLAQDSDALLAPSVVVAVRFLQSSVNIKDDCECYVGFRANSARGIQECACRFNLELRISIPTIFA
jgi:hypothetical protein